MAAVANAAAKAMKEPMAAWLPFEAAQVGLESDVLTRLFEAADEAGLTLPDDSQILRDRLSVFSIALALPVGFRTGRRWSCDR